jgi:hypothetical protein
VSKSGSEFVDSVVRSRSPRAAQQRAEESSGDVSALADSYLDAMLTGLAGVHAVIDELSNEDGGTGEAPSGFLPDDATNAFNRAEAAFGELRDEVDALLEAHDLSPTTADIEAATADVEE